MARYIDLTVSLEDGMRGVSSEVAREIKKDGWNATTFHIYSHSGTHMDAPLHFEVSDQTIDQFPVERFFVKAWIVDLTHLRIKEKITEKSVEHLIPVLSEGDGILFKTGWNKYINTPQFRENLPGFTPEMAQWCVDHKIGLVGVEPPSVADVNNMEELTLVHRILLENDVLIVEGLVNLDAISKDWVQLVALPLKFKGADGAPARVVAIEED